jgi:hypothetical protein
MQKTKATHLIDYSRHETPQAAFAEWITWVCAMAPLDHGIYD